MTVRQLAGKIYRKLVPIMTRYQDIRVYANFVAERGLDHIHYGCWENGTKDMKAAQENIYQKKIKPMIPPGVRTILDIGGGVGGVSNQLMSDGYETLCIVPDKAIIDIGKKKFPRVPFLKSTAEQFSVPKKYDAALMVESFQYFSDKPRALSNITGQISPDGCIIIVEEFSLVSDGGPKESDLMSLMESRNYYPANRIDISEQVAPSCRYIYEELEKYPEGKAFAKRWRENEEKFKAGQRQYLVMRFEPKAKSK